MSVCTICHGAGAVAMTKNHFYCVPLYHGTAFQITLLPILLLRRQMPFDVIDGNGTIAVSCTHRQTVNHMS